MQRKFMIDEATKFSGLKIAAVGLSCEPQGCPSFLLFNPGITGHHKSVTEQHPPQQPQKLSSHSFLKAPLATGVYINLVERFRYTPYL